ncbi:hypothetical protein BOX15_Mlig025361g1 [Macrostomum lignano]|uniref:IkappaB kinase n=1 Tax=Macrostomum lignano TaxID=282301 RepID=A0A267EJL6_9PLAT|nr:hypothetical protein BOX15_Mlig025361g1 [Macrostomum lignano]
MDARSVGVGPAAMSRANAAAAAAAATAAAQSSPRRGAYNLVVAGNYTWCPDLDYLADGVTSSVYRCRDIHTGDFYAVKVFKGTPPRREVELLKKLKHENIVRLITGVQFQDNMRVDKTGLILEYCCGNSLHEYLKKPDNKLGMHDRDFLSLLYNMCDGLAYLREQLKIVHRDIKPGNIMISYDNRRQPVFKLADFGSSRELEDGADFQSLVGTYEFLHPSIYLEVHQRMHAGMGDGARGGHKPECDLWSLGVSLFMAATGRLPFAPFEGVRSNHAQMIDMMVKKPPHAIWATQDTLNGPINYHNSLPPTCPLSVTLQKLLVELLQGILVSNFNEQWTFPKFFETVNWYKCQHCTYYFVAGNMIMPDLVFSQKQSLDSLLTSLASVTSFPKEEIVVFYRSQEVSAFPTGSTLTSPVIVLSKQQFTCTLDIGKFDVGHVKSRPRVPDPNQPKEIKDFVDEAHRHALVCRQLASVCHVNHALTLEAKDAALCLMDRRGREAYQRVRAKLAVVSSSEQKVGRLMELAQLVRTQTGCQELSDKISQWQRKLETVVSQQSNLKPDAASNSGSALAGMSNEQSSLVPSLQLASNFNGIFARLLAPKQGAECLSADFHRVEQVYERYGQMINKFMKKDSQLLTDLMRHCFKSDQHLLNSCLDDCQNVVLRCCIETLGNVQAGLSEWMQDVQAEVKKLERLETALAAQDLEADLDMLHDNVYRGIFEALTAYFKATKASKESDLTALSKSIRDLILSTDLVQGEMERNTKLLKELDELGLQNTRP